MILTCTRRLTFEAGHRVLGHEGKCSSCHGHSYSIEIEACAENLDNIGRVIDFSVLKQRVGTWIDTWWDHGFIVYQEDGDLIYALKALSSKVFLLPTNPTAENIAAYLLETVCVETLRGTGVKIRRVRVWETENCFAEAVVSERE